MLVSSGTSTAARSSSGSIFTLRPLVSSTPCSAATRITRSAVSRLISLLPESTLDTVETDTPASLASSRYFMTRSFALSMAGVTRRAHIVLRKFSLQRSFIRT